MLILLPTFENTSDIFLYFVVDYQSEHPPLWHGPLNSTMCLFVYGHAVQVLLTVQYTRTHIMWVPIM